ncbi:putative ribonuclease P complex subunit Pop2 [Viridothelium virens]|uniref:Putative ribonuclease P complex subunit Pop2 n=1 Tax=Viridothelium virens TaxID=1048519 RepID=A0A6A6HA47_VIRVR|nr:putative ribonuclease P complex subunit Pop2 [Viridothelium virens]
MFYDLNVQWVQNENELQRTLSFLAELGYNVVALNYTLSGKLPSEITCPIPDPLPFPTPPTLRILRRCTLLTTSPSQNHRLGDLTRTHDLVALRPTDEATLLQACTSLLDCALISLDLTQRFAFPFKHRSLGAAIERGVKFEICYSPGILANDATARRNLISNATQLVRATRGRGLVISSEAGRALGCRAPWDVVNLAAMWGLGRERGREAVTGVARHAVVSAQLKRTSYRGVVDVVEGGVQPERGGKAKEKGKQAGNKRKLEQSEEHGGKKKLGTEEASKGGDKMKKKNGELQNATTVAATEDLTMRPD